MKRRAVGILAVVVAVGAIVVLGSQATQTAPQGTAQAEQASTVHVAPQIAHTAPAPVEKVSKSVDGFLALPAVEAITPENDQRITDAELKEYEDSRRVRPQHSRHWELFLQFPDNSGEPTYTYLDTNNIDRTIYGAGLVSAWIKQTYPVDNTGPPSDEYIEHDVFDCRRHTSAIMQLDTYLHGNRVSTSADTLTQSLSQKIDRHSPGDSALMDYVCGHGTLADIQAKTEQDIEFNRAQRAQSADDVTGN